MDRESLRPLVEAQFGESHLTVLSEETINAELDEALEGITDDAQVDDAFTKKIANRLLRMNGNVTKDAGTQISEWKKKHPTKQPTTQPQQIEETEETELQKLLKRVEAMENAQKAKSRQEANDAIADSVKKGLKAKFKTANVDVNEYILRQTLRDLEIPEVEEGQSVNVNDLISKMETAYHKNLKEAGLDKKDTARIHRGASAGDGNGGTALDEKFRKKALKEGWGKKD